MSFKQQSTDTNTIKNPDTWVSGEDPMTGAQASYLHTLSEEARVPLPEGDISKAEASKRIGELKREVTGAADDNNKRDAE